jgi:hypothetical protein
MKLNARFPVLLVAVACSSANAQQESPKTSAPAVVSNLVVLAPKLARLQNQFEHMVPPGVSIEAREVYRSGIAGTDLQVRYNIYVKGVPPDTIFRQLQWPVDRDKPIGGFTGITLNPEGLMICAGHTPEQCHNGTAFDAPVQFTRMKPLRGEPMRSIFIAPNLKIPISMVPDPIQSEDKGCKLSAVRLTGKFELALIEGSGFPSNSNVHLHRTNADGKSIVAVIGDDGMPFALFTAPDLVLKSDSSGAIQTVAPNNTSNFASGKDTVEVTGPGCNPKVTYDWGVF